MSEAIVDNMDREALEARFNELIKERSSLFSEFDVMRLMKEAQMRKDNLDFWEWTDDNMTKYPDMFQREMELEQRLNALHEELDQIKAQLRSLPEQRDTPDPDALADNSTEPSADDVVTAPKATIRERLFGIFNRGRNASPETETPEQPAQDNPNEIVKRIINGKKVKIRNGDFMKVEALQPRYVKTDRKGNVTIVFTLEEDITSIAGLKYLQRLEAPYATIIPSDLPELLTLEASSATEIPTNFTKLYKLVIESLTQVPPVYLNRCKLYFYEETTEKYVKFSKEEVNEELNRRYKQVKEMPKMRLNLMPKVKRPPAKLKVVLQSIKNKYEKITRTPTIEILDTNQETTPAQKRNTISPDGPINGGVYFSRNNELIVDDTLHPILFEEYESLIEDFEKYLKQHPHATKENLFAQLAYETAHKILQYDPDKHAQLNSEIKALLEEDKEGSKVHLSTYVTHEVGAPKHIALLIGYFIEMACVKGKITGKAQILTSNSKNKRRKRQSATEELQDELPYVSFQKESGEIQIHPQLPFDISPNETNYTNATSYLGSKKTGLQKVKNALYDSIYNIRHPRSTIGHFLGTTLPSRNRRRKYVSDGERSMLTHNTFHQQLATIIPGFKMVNRRQIDNFTFFLSEKFKFGEDEYIFGLVKCNPLLQRGIDNLRGRQKLQLRVFRKSQLSELWQVDTSAPDEGDGEMTLVLDKVARNLESIQSTEQKLNNQGMHVLKYCLEQAKWSLMYRELTENNNPLTPEKDYTEGDDVSGLNMGECGSTFYRGIDSDTLETIQYPDNFIPNFSQRPTRTLHDHHELLGETTIEVYEGEVAVYDKKSESFKHIPIEWFMEKTVEGERTWIRAIRYKESSTNSYGAPARVLNTGILTTKPVKAKAQVSGKEGIDWEWCESETADEVEDEGIITEPGADTPVHKERHRSDHQDLDSQKPVYITKLLSHLLPIELYKAKMDGRKGHLSERGHGHGHDTHGHEAHGHDTHGHDTHGHEAHGHEAHGHDTHGHEAHGHGDDKHREEHAHTPKKSH